MNKNKFVVVVVLVGLGLAKKSFGLELEACWKRDKCASFSEAGREETVVGFGRI